MNTAIQTCEIKSISPSSGCAQNQTITINGEGFTGATAVHFGNVGATNFTVVSDTEVTATLPVGTGTVDIRVDVPTGLSPVNAPVDQFTYLEPAVTGVSPSNGSINGSGEEQTVTINGLGFTGALNVQFNGTATTNFTVISDSQIITAYPPMPLGTGTVNVQVDVPTGCTPLNAPADQFTFQALPVIETISPNTGANAGGTTVTLTGSGFIGATAVMFGTEEATIVTGSITDMQMVVTSPAGNGTADVTVTTPIGTSDICAADQFMYTTIPFYFNIPNDVAANGIYLSMFGCIQNNYKSISAGSNVVLVNTGSGYDYMEASTILQGQNIPPFLSANSTVSGLAINIPNISIQAQRVVIGISQGVLTTLSVSSGNQALPQSIINVASTGNFAASGVLYIATATGVTQVSYTGISGNSFTGCSGGSGTLLANFTVSSTPVNTPAVNDSNGDITAPTPSLQGNSIYDFFEFSYLPVGSALTLTINTSAVDQFGIPLVLDVEGGTVQPGNQVGVITSRHNTIDAFKTFVAGTAYSELIVQNSPGNTPVRILSPSDQLTDNPVQGLVASKSGSANGTLNTLTVYSYAVTAVINNVEMCAAPILAQSLPSSKGCILISWGQNQSATSYNIYRGTPNGSKLTWSQVASNITTTNYMDTGGGGRPVSPTFDPLGGYFNTAIEELFTAGNVMLLTVTDGSTPANGLQYTCIGTAKQAPDWVNAATATTGQTVMEFQCLHAGNNINKITPLIPNGSLFYVFKPFFNTNTQNPDHPDPPVWNGDLMNYANLFPSAMVYGGNGVFADNVQQSAALYCSLTSTSVSSASGQQQLPQATISVESTAGFQTSGTLYIGGLKTLVTYTGVTETSFTGCSGGSGTLSQGITVYGGLQLTGVNGDQALPSPTITVNSTAGYPLSGTLYIGTDNIAVTYTGTTATSFTGCSGGSGTLSSGDPVKVNNCQPAGLDLNAYSVALGSMEDKLDAAILRGISGTINAINWANAPANLAATEGPGGNLESPATYYYVITAQNSAGESTPGNEVSFTPANGSVTLSWNPVNDALLYTIYRGTSAGGENELIATTTNTIFNDTQNTYALPPASPPAKGAMAAPLIVSAILANGGTLPVQACYYVITALGISGESIASNEVTLTTTANQSSVTLTWLQVANASAYKIYRGASAGNENELAGIIQGNATFAFTDTGSTAQTPPPNIYYAPGTTSDLYAQFFHQTSISIGGLAYASPYDDQGNQSSTIAVTSPQSVTVSLGKWAENQGH